MTAETTETVTTPVRSRLARRVLEVPPSGIRKFFDVVATMPDVISLGIGEPDFTTPPQIIEEGVRSLRSGRTHYTSNYGTIELRRALSPQPRAAVRRRPTTRTARSWSPSAPREALAIAFAAIIDPGDEVILHEPSYVAYIPGITFAGGVPVLRAHAPAGRLGARPRCGWRRPSRRAPRPCSWATPATPPARCWSLATLRAIADIAARHDLIVISDEIYDRLVYGDHQHEAFSALPGMSERTILLGGFSKAYAMTGWRVGYACAPRDLMEGLVKVHQYQIMSAPTTAQDAALVALTVAEQDVQRMVSEYDRRRRMFVDGLNRIGLPTVEPRGAFYAFPRISGTRPHERPVQRAAAVRAPRGRRPGLRLRTVG